MNGIVPQNLSPKPTDPDRQVLLVQAICLFIILILVLGLWLQAPYLDIEHSRLELWKIFGLWCADILALVWFARFTLAHAILREPLVPVPFENGRRQLKAVIYAGTAALLVDAAVAAYAIWDEHQSYARGQVAEGTVLDIRETRRAVETWYEVHCRFKDSKEVMQTVWLRVESDRNTFVPTLPAQTISVLLSHSKNGDTLAVRYDPQFPARAWADGAGWDDGQRIYWFALLTLFFQAMVTAVFLLQLAKRSASNLLPWWWDIYKVLPLFVGGFWLFIMGLIDRLMDSLP
jgi:hypothetical protein